jgi:hypothetical protein
MSNSDDGGDSDSPALADRVTTSEAPATAAELPLGTRLVVSAMSLGSAAIHFAVIQAHFDEEFLFGVFFAAVACLQVLWALWIVLYPDRRVLEVGAWASGGVALVWVISRTVGLPIGPHPWQAEPVTWLDGVATALEVGVMILVLAQIRFERAWGPWIATACVLIASTATISASEPHSHSEEGHAHEEAEAGLDPQLIENGAFSTVTSDGEITTAPLFAGYAESFLLNPAAGPNEIHVGFFTRSGQGLEIETFSISVRGRDSAVQELEPERLTPSHFLAPVELDVGAWTFRVEAVTESGQQFVTQFREQIKP